MAEHELSAEPTHSRWNRLLNPRLVISPGDTVHLECVDSSGAQVRPGMTVAEMGTGGRFFSRSIAKALKLNMIV